MDISQAIALNSTPSAVGELRGERTVLRLPGELRLHPILDDFNFLTAEELNISAELKELAIPEPVIITSDGTILAGFGAWTLAKSAQTAVVQCVEYAIEEEEILPFILHYHQPRHTWNAFVRISIALRLKFDLHQRALDNMRTGGRCKGLTNLSKADCMNVRHKIAKIAGTGTGNVNKVETILDRAHPNIIFALQNGLLSIHQAWKWCELSKTEQKEEFARHEEKGTRRKILRGLSIGKSRMSLDPLQVIEALQHRENQQPGSITVRASRNSGTTVILGEDLLEAIAARKEILFG
jgi:hypothetical protein